MSQRHDHMTALRRKLIQEGRPIPDVTRVITNLARISEQELRGLLDVSRKRPRSVTVTAEEDVVGESKPTAELGVIHDWERPVLEVLAKRARLDVIRKDNDSHVTSYVVFSNGRTRWFMAKSTETIVKNESIALEELAPKVFTELLSKHPQKLGEMHEPGDVLGVFWAVVKFGADDPRSGLA